MEADKQIVPTSLVKTKDFCFQEFPYLQTDDKSTFFQAIVTLFFQSSYKKLRLYLIFKLISCMFQKIIVYLHRNNLKVKFGR